MAGSRRARNQSNSIVIPRQISNSDNGRSRQGLNAECLASMTKEQLRAECRKRGQRSTGNKNELLSRLGYYKLAGAPQPPDAERSPAKPNNGLQKDASKQTKPPAMESDSLVLWRRPITTLDYFLRELFILVSTGLRRLLSYRLLALSLASLAAATAVSCYVDGPHQPYVQLSLRTLAWWGWWLTLGVCSSVGLGTGLHTFLLYLGPHIARVTLAAYECGSLDFASPPYPDEIICPPAAGHVSVWAIMGKVRVESMLWGLGTALGELPPYFMARAARASGSSSGSASGSGPRELEVDEKTLVGRAKRLVQRLVQRAGFLGILACASVPNPLFDLAGLTCGHFLVPFWTFFGATVLGKAVVKMHIQKMFVIVAFNETLVGQALTWVERVPYAGPRLGAPLLEFLRDQRAKLHRDGGSPGGGSGGGPLGGPGGGPDPPAGSGALLASLMEKFVLVMVLYFVVSIVNALAQSYSKRGSKKRGKKRE